MGDLPISPETLRRISGPFPTEAEEAEQRAQAINKLADECVKEWQQEAKALVRDHFGWLRRHLGRQAKSADMAASTRDSRQARVIAKQLANQEDQEHQLMELIRSLETVDEAHRYALWNVKKIAVERKRKNTDASPEPKPELPKLLNLHIFLRGMRERRHGLDDDAWIDRFMDEWIRKTIVEDTVTLEPSREQESPKQYLTNWREILVALEKTDNKEDRSRIKALNDRYAGPIISPKQGAQPKVEKAKLLVWWNGLEKQFQESQQQRSDAEATVAAQHPYGRGGTVVPGIVGGVRKRRDSTR